MVNEKERIIKKLGIPCSIRNPGQVDSIDTTCLIKRTTGSMNVKIETLESHRRGDFIYSDGVTGGSLIINKISNEQLLSVGTYPEVFRDMVLATVAHLLVTNTVFTAYRKSKRGTPEGNIVIDDIAIEGAEDIPSYIEHNKDNLRQFEVGLHPDAEFIIFSPQVEVKPLDTIKANVHGGTLDLKVTYVDIVAFAGVSLLHVQLETRR